MSKNDELKKSKHFCLMPWIHYHIWPNGDVYPCCMADPNQKFGNIHKSTIKEIINSEPFNALRKNMLSDQPSSACRRCYELEESADVYTLRKNSLKSFGDEHFARAADNTSPGGELNDFKMAYMDIRFSNLCNFKCRTCGPIFSSAWSEEEDVANARTEKTPPLSLLNRIDFWDQLEPMLDHVEEVYFAGGESLISPEHYKILDYWLHKNMNQVRLRYTTNFSHFRFKAKSLLDYWGEFSNVRVAASLDAEGARGEYLRKGTNWKVIVANRREMIEKCPHVYFEITPTISVFNCFSLPDFHRNWIEEGLLEPGNIRINYLLDPVNMRAQILPAKAKEQLKEKYLRHISYLEGLEKSQSLNLTQTKKDFSEAINFFFAQDLNHEVASFKKLNQLLDARRGENLRETFPELECIC
jgi:radical SAM protein with 4Fe4S-binding SPASM domain